MTTTETASAPEAAGPTTTALGPDTAARAHLTLGPFFLLVGLGAYLGVAIKLVRPEFLGDLAFASYGRLLPVATNLLLWGWLTPVLIGSAFYMVPRMAGSPLRLRPLAWASLGLVVTGAAGGAFSVANGGNAGGRLLELPLWADLVLLGGFGCAALVVTATAWGGDRSRLPVAQWYFVAASWWLVLAAGVGAVVPALDGMAAALTGWFSVTSVIGLWLVAAGLGVAYYLVERLVPEVVFHPTLGRIGFWSIAFAWAWTAPRAFTYGPTPEWLETAPVVFAGVLVVAGFAIVGDFGMALSRKWEAAGSSLPVGAVLGGLALFALMPFGVLVQSLRGASAVIHFTAWETAFEQLALLGAVTLWAFGAVAHVLSTVSGSAWSRRTGRIHLWLFGTGLAITLVSRWVGGLQQGYGWIGGVNSGAYPNYGPGYRNSVQPLEGLQWMQVIGLGLMLAAVVVFASAVVRRALGRSRATEDPLRPPRTGIPAQSLGTVLGGAVLLFALAGAGVVLVPAFDAETKPSMLAEESRDFAAGSAAELGREIYLREGCWYCHTQQVRASVADVGLGPVSVPGDYAFDPADLAGLERVGPDLAHVGSRIAGHAEWGSIPMTTYLSNPDAGRPWSQMPAYDHLSGTELEALAAYLAALE